MPVYGAEQTIHINKGKSPVYLVICSQVSTKACQEGVNPKISPTDAIQVAKKDAENQIGHIDKPATDPKLISMYICIQGKAWLVYMTENEYN
ncbi:hypothetical protein P7H25_25325 [Paenibacillus larvae]|nr:hypothetical protein [Paenibacillus larvae]MDT2258191.1 hypothetical protein [Paenibacillus larvae]